MGRVSTRVIEAWAMGSQIIFIKYGKMLHLIYSKSSHSVVSHSVVFSNYTSANHHSIKSTLSESNDSHSVGL